MFRSTVIALALVAVAPRVHAGSCEENFTKTGSLFTRVDYTSRVTVPDAAVADVLGQMRAIFIGDKMDVITEDVASGSMLAEQRATDMARAVPVLVNASAEGGATTVEMTVKTERGQLAKADAVKTEMCRLLGMLKGGKAGKSAAAAGRKQQNADPTTFRDVYIFSREIAAEAQANAVAVNARQRGRKYALKGKVDYIMEDGPDYNVSFKIPQQSEVMLRMPNDPPRVGVACLFRPSQMASVLTFRKGDMATFKGSFLRYDDLKRMVWLENCTPAKG
ncbi:hypothetical protein [Lysobacter xanthus]